MDSTKTKMRFFLIWLRVKKNNLINSKAFIFLLGLIIGASALFIYVEGSAWYSWLQTGLVYANSTHYVSGVPASDPVSEKVFDKETEGISSDLPSQSIQELINKYDWDKKVAYAVAKAESNLISDAYNENTNGSWDMGIFQINSIHGYGRQDMEDPAKNTESAYQIYLKAGRQFTPWVVFKTGQYRYELN